MSDTNYTDPYLGLPEYKKDVPTPTGAPCVHFTTIKISAADRAFINGVHGARPTIIITAAILLNRAITALKLLGVGPDYDPEAYERAIGATVITIIGQDGRSVSVGPGQTAGTTSHSTPTVGGTHAGVQRSPVVDNESHRETPARNDRPGTEGLARVSNAAYPVAADVGVAHSSAKGAKRKRVKKGGSAE